MLAQTRFVRYLCHLPHCEQLPCNPNIHKSKFRRLTCTPDSACAVAPQASACRQCPEGQMSGARSAPRAPRVTPHHDQGLPKRLQQPLKQLFSPVPQIHSDRLLIIDTIGVTMSYKSARQALPDHSSETHTTHDTCGLLVK